MANTTNTQVLKSEGWKSVISAGSGVFSASSTCNYTLAETTPSEDLYGHRLDGGDEINFLVGTVEELYFKTSNKVTIVVTQEAEL